AQEEQSLPLRINPLTFIIPLCDIEEKDIENQFQRRRNNGQYRGDENEMYAKLQKDVKIQRQKKEIELKLMSIGNEIVKLAATNDKEQK
ncbi:hypothetical protein, partial [Aeromonas veronii]|uniref:hypothetical protein n=1 Tax=Aeromonas veronii TaxID=654 RepID=UPI00406C839A